MPSAVSAIKVDGRAGVRAGPGGRGRSSWPPAPVTVSRLALVGWSRPTADLLDIDVDGDCSSGTYVRALARDLGAALGVGGHLTALRRTRVGPFTLAEAVTLERAGRAGRPGAVPLDAAAPPPSRAASSTADEADRLPHGGPLEPARPTRARTPCSAPTADAVALVEDRADAARSHVVFRPASVPRRRGSPGPVRT